MRQEYDLFTPSFLDNPYPVYHRLRAENPVFWYEPGRRWILTRYADVATALHDPVWSADRINEYLLLRTDAMRQEIQPLAGVARKQMLYVDPPDHTRLRGLVSMTFTPRVVERIRPRIEQIVNELLDRASSSRGMDVIRDFAYPLPATVILEILGLSAEQRDHFKTWSVDFAAFMANIHADATIDRRAQRSVLTALEHFRATVDQLRARPRDDLLSALALAEEQGEKLTMEELLANTMLLLLGGHETTTNLIGNGLLALLQNPEQLRRLQDDPTLIGTAVEEFLRYDSPVQYTVRATTADRELGGRPIPERASVMLVLGAANHDPEQFDCPDQLDIGRQPNRHLSLGQGVHYCLGAPLGRLEARIAISTVLSRFPTLRLATDHVDWQPNFAFRGLKALPVSW